MIVAGIGCRRRCSGDAVVALVHAAAARAGRTPTVLAAPAFKRDESGLSDAASVLGLDLLFITDAALAAAQSGCVTRSARAEVETGFASVAEACALAAAGAGAKLLVARIAVAGATCAVAEAI